MSRLIPYTKQWLTEADVKAVARAARRPIITRGEITKEFECELARITGAAYAVAVNSGTSALQIAGQIVQAEEVVIPPVTFCATANAFQHNKIRWAKTDPQTGLVAEVPRSVLVTVDLCGRYCDYSQIDGIPALVVRDACHSVPRCSASGGIRSDICVLSFHPAKHITTGEGGALLTNDRGFYENAILWRNNGLRQNPRCQVRVGGNYHMSELSAALGLSQLRRLDTILDRRRKWALAYTEKLKGLKHVAPPKAEIPGQHDWHLYAIRVDTQVRRDGLRSYLQARHVGTQVHYPPLYREPAWSHIPVPEDVKATADEYADHTLSIPLFPTMTETEFRYIVSLIRKWDKTV